MATAGVPLWSTTAASNATADPTVNWAEGMAPSAVNDSARAQMASVAKWRDDLYGVTSGLTTGGTSTAFTVTTNATYATAAVMSGALFTIVMNATSGAAPTLAVDGLTARALNVSTGVAVPTGALISGSTYMVRYLHATTEFIVLNPSIRPLTAIDIVGGTAKTTLSTSDSIPLYDLAGTANKKATIANLFAAFSFAGAQLPYGAVYNGTIAETNGTNAVTFALKTLAGADPSSSDPVLLAFRNATVATGNYVYRTVTAALSLTISSGSTMGFASGIAGKLWIVAFDDAGTIRLGAINCLSGSNIYPLGQMPIASSTAEGGSGGADSAQVFYTGTAVTSKPYLILGYVSYESGIATAGSWNASPTRIELYGPGVPLPGQMIQRQRNVVLAASAGSTAIPQDDTIPQNTEGDQYFSQAITPTSATNWLDFECQPNMTSGGAGVSDAAIALFQDSTAGALACTMFNSSNAGDPVSPRFSFGMLAGINTSTTFKIRIGNGSGRTMGLNGTSNAGARFYGGVLYSYLEVREVMA